MNTSQPSCPGVGRIPQAATAAKRTARPKVAQTGTGTPSSTEADPGRRGWIRRLGERVIEARGPGGLALKLIPKPGFAEKLAILGVEYGSVDLLVQDGREKPRPTPPGIAHFLEHVLFETAEGNASDLFSARGASSNAFTDYTQTGYLFAAPDRWAENLTLLLDFVFRPPFPPGKVEKERGIIVQELRMYRDSPGSRIGENLHQALYRRHPVRLDIGGTPESVRKIRREDLLRCHAAFYRPANMCLVAVGDLRMGDLMDIAAAQVPARAPRGLPRHHLPAEPAGVARREIAARMDVAQPQALIGFKDPAPAAAGLPLLRRRIAVGLALSLLFDRTAPLYQALYDEGLIDEDFSASYFSEPGAAYAAVGGKTKDPRRLRARILEGIAEARREGFPAAALALAGKKALGGYLRLFDSSHGLAAGALSAHFLGLSLFDFPRELAACGMGAVRGALPLLAASRHALSVIRPLRD